MAPKTGTLPVGNVVKAGHPGRRDLGGALMGTWLLARNSIRVLKISEHVAANMKNERSMHFLEKS
jgi:hypothetical protein